MPYSRMTPEELEQLFGAGIIISGPKRRSKTNMKPAEPFLTPEQDAQIEEIFRAQERPPTEEMRKKSRGIGGLISGLLSKTRTNDD